MRPASPLSFRFNVGSTPVLVEPTFWLTALLLGYRLRSTQMILAWMGVVFVSVLVHELGHAGAARLFGSRSSILLHSFGGTTYPDRVLRRWPEVLMTLAGPFAGFALAALVYGVLRFSPPPTFFSRQVLALLMQVNISWGLLNLMPVPPLDGGHVLLGVLGPSRRRVGYFIGLVVAVAAVAWALGNQETYLAVLFGWLGFSCFQAYQRTRDVKPLKPVARTPARPPAPQAAAEPDALARGWEALRVGREQEAARLGYLALEAAPPGEERNGARELLAWVSLAAGDARGALSHLERVQPPEAARPLTLAMAHEAAGQPGRALPHALKALEREPSETAASLAVRLLVAEGRLDEAERLGRTFAWGREAVRDSVLADVAAARGDFAGAAQLSAAAFEAGGRPDDAYKAACGHARAGQGERAAEWLRRALEAGYDDLEALAREPALAEVRTRADIAPHLTRR